jgi:toxin CptA
MARVSLCAVATVRALLQQRQASGVAALVVAASTAGALLLGTALLTGHRETLALGPAVSWPLAMGGVLLGLGALLNGGCYLSSVTYVGTGNFHYLLTLSGFAFTAHFLPVAPHAAVSAMRPYVPVLAGWGLFVAVTAFALRYSRSLRADDAVFSWRRRWPWPLAAVACGGMAALVNLQMPNWSYSKLLEALARPDAGGLGWRFALPAIAIFAGAISSSLLAGQFQLARPSVVKAARCVGGGILMAYAAAQVPGGNDSLLLWAIPSLALYGLVAYLLMLATISCALACAPLGASWLARVLPRA